MASIDYARFALVLKRCAEIAGDATAGSKLARAYHAVLAPAALPFLAAHEAALSAERGFERENRDLCAAMDALDPSYRVARAVVRKHFPDAGIPEMLLPLAYLSDKAMAIEALLNILDDSMDEPWAVVEISGEFAEAAPAVVKELGEAIMLDTALRRTFDARASTYGLAFERHLLFKRVVREAFGPHSGQYQSIHWRVAWAHEGAGPVSWGPFSFRAPVRTW